MKKSDRPSEFFVDMIRYGYDQAALESIPVTCSAIWDHVLTKYRQMSFSHPSLFEWDTSEAQHINRIGTIQECIKRGYVPGLRLSFLPGQGHKLIVERC